MTSSQQPTRVEPTVSTGQITECAQSSCGTNTEYSSNNINNSSSGVTVDSNTTASGDLVTGIHEIDPLEAYYEELARQQIAFIVVGTIGIIGNSLVIFILGSSAKVRSKIVNMLLINQSAVDLVTAILMVCSSGIDDRSGGHVGIAGWLFCKLWAFKQPMWAVFMSSTYNLLCITLERYMEVLHPIYHKTSLKHRHVLIAIAFVWFIGPFYNIFLMVVPTEMVNGYCLQMSNWPSLGFKMAVAVFTTFIEYFIPLGIMAYAYTRMAMRLKVRVHPVAPAPSALPLPAAGNNNQEVDRREEKSARARRGVMRTFYMVSFAFFFCWAWNQTYFLIFNLGILSELSGTFYHFTVYVAFVNCVINPFIYAAQYRDFQRQTKKLFCPKAFQRQLHNQHMEASASRNDSLIHTVAGQVMPRVTVASRVSS